MSPPTELSMDEILKFMLAHNGKVTNHDLVKHFKVFLTNPDMRDEARSTFKRHVNSLAIIKSQNNEKWLILKKKYMPHGSETSEQPEIKAAQSQNTISNDNLNTLEKVEPIPQRPPLPMQLNQDFSILKNLIDDTNVQNATSLENIHNIREVPIENLDETPPVIPRRKSSDKSISDKSSHRSSIPNQDVALSPVLTTSRSESMLIDNEQKISVKERKQMFNRMASESDVLKTNKLGSNFNTSMSSCDKMNNSSKSGRESYNGVITTTDGEFWDPVDNKLLYDFCENFESTFEKQFGVGSLKRRAQNEVQQPASKLQRSTEPSTSAPESVDEEDRASLDQKSEVDPLDSNQKRWILCAARGDYHALAKMCKENPKLVRTKDPFTTALHWACKRGDENLVKLLAGVHRNVVNERSGYTPLHIAMQFQHENVYRLLVEVYDADPNMYDWSGRKPRQCLILLDTSLCPLAYRSKNKEPDLSRTVTSPPDVKVTPSIVQYHPKKESFLRIGSLNVRVKKTTEAFSNFLGVGATRSSQYMPKSARERDDGDQLHKSWGSADNIQKDDKLMPPPPNSKIRRRNMSGRRHVGSHSRSTPSTPDQPRANIGINENGDSDSDSAAGFHSSWRQQRASCT